MQASVLALFLTVIGFGVCAEHDADLRNDSTFCASSECFPEGAALMPVFLQTKLSQEQFPPSIHSHVQLNQHSRRAYTFEADSLESQRNRRKPFFYYHIHKAAGTTMCQLAQDNGEVIIDPKATCNWAPDYNHKWARMITQHGYDTPADCSQRLKWWIDTRFSWSQIERPFNPNSMFCPSLFGYATSLRDPIHSLESMLNYFDPDEPQNFRMRQQEVQCFLRGITESCQDNLGPAEDSLWIYFDNPMVRLLGGPEIMELSFGGVNSSHADKVLDLLARFDLVICVEELSSNATQNKLRTILGWNSWDAGVQLRASEKTLLLTDADKDMASNLNAHDYKVYHRYCNLSTRVN